MNPQEEKRIVRYLLGAASPNVQQQVEERLLLDDEYADQLMMVESELIDDYMLGTLSADERERFETHFLVTEKRRQKLVFARGLKRYVLTEATSAPVSVAFGWNPFVKLHTSIFPGWKYSYLAIGLLALTFSLVWYYSTGTDVDDALVALNQAYREHRPVESRITGFGYTPYIVSPQRGGVKEERIDYVALERAKTLLFVTITDRSSPSLLHAHGKYFLAQKEFDKAIDQLSSAVESEPKNARMQSDLGAALLGKIERDRLTANGRENKDINNCLIHLNRALDLDPSLPEPLFNRALLYQHEKLRRQAREDWEKYLQKDPNSPWADEARQNLKAIEEELKKVTLREEQLYQDFLAAIKTGDDVESLKKFGLSYSFNGSLITRKLIDDYLEAKLKGQTDQARENIRVLSRIGNLVEEKIGDRFISTVSRHYRRDGSAQLLLLKQARDSMIAGYEFAQQSRNDTAIEKYEQARRLFQQAGDTGEALLAEALIGQSHHQRSDTEQNLQVFKRLVRIAADRKYLWMEANAYCGLANAHNSSGRFSEAIDDCLKCEGLSKRVGDQVGLIRSLILRGDIFQALGKHREVLRLSQQGLDLSDQFSAYPRYVIGFYQNSSRSLSNIGLFEAARAFQLESIRIAEETKSPRLRARAYVHLGLIYGKWEKYDDAISNIQRGIAIGPEVGNDETGQELVHYGLLHLGNVYRAAGKFDEALNAFNQIIDFFQRSRREIYLYAGLKGRLLTFIAQKNGPAAKAELNRVIKLYENYRKSIQEESNRNRFFDQEQGIYDIAIDFAYSWLGDPKKALAYSELSRARSLLDESSRGWKMINGYEAPDLRIDTGSVPADPDKIQSQMPNHIQLVEYTVVDDKLLIWLISKTSIKSQSVKISQAELTVRVKQYLEIISQPPGKVDWLWQELSAELSDLLVRPIEGFLDRQKQVCIIPDKILCRLPFGTLVLRRSETRESDKLLMEEFQLLYASSANLFLNLSEKAGQKLSVKEERLLAVGNPDFFQGDFQHLSTLPSAEREAVSVAAYYKSPTLLVKNQARKKAVIREMERADVVHLASHYDTDAWSPMLSKIPMASAAPGDPEKALYMYELYRYKSLQPRLVVLSACQTSAEEYLGGEGAIGISRSFKTVGIPLVIASLWPVDTDATADLMIEFHRKRKQGKLLTIDALRTAQQTFFSRKDKYCHPYYWAAFVAVGGYSQY